MAFGIGSLAISAIVVFEFFGFSNKVSHGLLFVMFAVHSLASTFILLKVKESDRSKRPKKKESGPDDKTSHKRSRSILAKYVLTSAIIAFGAGMVVPLMTAWLRLQYGIPDIDSGPILGFVSIVIGVATLAGTADRKKVGSCKGNC